MRALVCSEDQLIRETADSAATSQGFEVTGELHSVSDLLSLLVSYPTDLVVVDNDQIGQPAMHRLPEIRQAAPLAAILLILNDHSVVAAAHQAGAFGCVHKDHLIELPGAIGRARRWLESPALRQPGQRRSGDDRRQHQDWSMVTHERRSGHDRRN